MEEIRSVKDPNRENWKKLNTASYTIRIQNKTGIPEALLKAVSDKKTTNNAFIIEAIREKLIRDGYLQPEESQEN